MFLIAPRFTNLQDERERMVLVNFLQRAAQVANNITLLDQDGASTDGNKAGNLDAVWVVYVSNSSADTEDTVAHNLGRIPLGMLIGIPDKDSVIYNGTTTWTSTNLFLRASAATTTVNLVVF